MKDTRVAGRPGITGNGFLLGLARWSLLGILGLAPWAYGCTRWWILPWFSGAVLGCVALWVGGLIQRRRKPAGSKWLLGLAIYLVAHGWLLVVNTGFQYDREHLQFLEIKPRLAGWLPGGIDAADARPMMLRLSGLLGVMLVAGDAARHAIWRRQLFWTVLFSGTLLAFYGMAQRFSPVPLLFWEQADLSHNLFATYYYHGNAGAFMNLVLPFACGAAIQGFGPNQSPGRRTLGAAALFVNLAAAVAIASKAAQCITILLLAASVFAYRRDFLPASQRWKPGLRTLAIVLLGFFCLGALALTGDVARQRWEMLPRLFNSDNARLLAYKACLKMLPDAGWWGIGPGNFALAFPHYTRDLPDAISGIWTYAHEDYLQTAIEWGWIGAAAWAVVLIGAFGKGWARLKTRGRDMPFSAADALIYRSGFLALVGVALHSLVDFPMQIASIQVYAATFIGLLWGQPTGFGGAPRFKERSTAEDRSA